MTENQAISEERLAKSFPYTTPSGHIYHAPTDYRSLSARVMDYLQSVIECWDEDESPPHALAFTEFAKIAWNEAVRANEEIDRLRAENERLTAWVEDLQSGMYINCVYCGHRYGPGETTPVSMADALKEHVEQCPEHPMSALRAEVDRWVGHYVDLLVTGIEIETAHNNLREAVKDYIANALNPEPTSTPSED